MAAFADTPYDFAAYEVNFADYGLPQARRRILFIGSRIPFEFPRKVKPHTPCGVAFLDPVDGLPNSAQRGGGNKRYDYFGRFVREGATGYNTSKRLWTYGGGNNKLDLRKPARTILSNVRGYYLPTGEKITFRHGARLQGFPDDFEFLGNDHDVGKQIGNAIPPVGFLPFAQKFYEAIQRHKGSQVQ